MRTIILFLSVLLPALLSGIAAADEACPDISGYFKAAGKLINETPAEAARIFEETTRLCPTSANAHYNLALARLREGSFRKALPGIERAYALAPQSVPVASLYITVLIAGDIDVKKGGSMLEKAAVIYPDNADMEKARIASLLSDPEAVGKLYSPLLSLDSGKSVENGRYRVSTKDNTVADSKSGLMWEYTNNEYLEYSKALKYCRSLRLGGFENWTIPNKAQMKTLVVAGRRPMRAKPMFDGDVFRERPVKRYWISDKPTLTSMTNISSGLSNSGKTFNMERAKTGDYPESSPKHVWCVREMK